MRGLAPIVLRVFFDLSGVIDRGEIRRGLDKTEVGGWKLKKRASLQQLYNRYRRLSYNRLTRVSEQVLELEGNR